MFSTSAAVFGVSSDKACRCVEALVAKSTVDSEEFEESQDLDAGLDDFDDVAGSPDRHLFLVGTQKLSAGNSNEIHVVEYLEEGNRIESRVRMPHPGEVWQIAPHPSKRDLLLTVGGSDVARQGTLFRMDIEEGQLDELAKVPLTPDDSPLRKIMWHPPENLATTDLNAEELTERFLSVHEDFVRLWDVESSLSRMDDIGTCSLPGRNRSGAARWSPHHIHEVSVGSGEQVVGLDLRSMEVIRRIDGAHRLGVRDIDYNPNKPYHLVTAGEDRRIKFWDVRKPDQPLKVVVAHNHWVTTARYNRFHDQLVLSAGTDAHVSLWRLSSISSAPLLGLDDDDDDENCSANNDDNSSGIGGDDEDYSMNVRGGSRRSGQDDGDRYSHRGEDISGGSGQANETADGLVKTFEEHDDSVYSVAWSAAEAWVFASLSLDGKLVINHVPSAEKYKILL